MQAGSLRVSLTQRMVARLRPRSAPSQELAHILDLIGGSEHPAKPASRPTGNAAEPVADNDGATSSTFRPHGPLQTMVFSATLTLPSALRQRLRKGGGGSSGSAMLQVRLSTVLHIPVPLQGCVLHVLKPSVKVAI